MEIKGIKINIIILVIVIVIGLFFAGQYFFRVYNIEKPVIEEILAIDGVNDVNILDNNGKVDIMLNFDSEIDFYYSYQEVKNIMEDRLASRSGNIVIDNHEITELEDIYYRLHFAVYEGINTSHFVEMEQNVGKIAENYNVDNYKLWLDSDAIYIQIDKNKNSFYKRIPYNKNILVEAVGGVNHG